MKTKYIILFLIITIAFFLRFLFLDTIPSGISDDELNYVFTAKTVFLTGTDISGTWSPFSLKAPPSENPQAELPYLLMAPLIGILPLSLSLSKLTHVIFSLFLIMLLYLIAKKLVNETAALFVATVSAINPWSIFFGRTANDTPLAVFFYFLSLYLLLALKRWKILFAFPALFLAFYTYIGTKLIFLPFLLIVLIYSFLTNNRKYAKANITLFLLGIALFFYFILTSFGQIAGTRYSELSSPSSSSIANQVNVERKLSIKTPLTNAFSNKLSIYAKNSFEKYMSTFSIGNLFLYGEGRSTFSVWYHGLFYYLDILFLLIGLYALFNKYRKSWLLLTGLAIIAPFPSVISNVGTSYALRSSLLYPILIIFIGFGIYYVFNRIKNKKYKYSFILAITLLYLILLANFINIYFLRNPIYNSESYGFSNRVLMRYIDLSKNKNKVHVIDDRGSTLFKHYLFYTNSYGRYNVKEISKIFKTGLYNFDNITWTECPKEKIPKNEVVVATYTNKCPSIQASRHITIAQLADGGSVYNVYNDKLCSKYKLNRYPKDITFRDLSVEKLSTGDFCQKFITKF